MDLYNKNKIYAIAKLGGQCVACGAIERLCFDHILNERKGDKTKLISQLLKYTNRAKLDVELKKCQLLCVSCHGKKTMTKDYRRPKNPQHGTVNSYNNYGCRCDLCRLANTRYKEKYLKRYRNKKKILELV